VKETVADDAIEYQWEVCSVDKVQHTDKSG